jgi:hypothetical protein
MLCAGLILTEPGLAGQPGSSTDTPDEWVLAAATAESGGKSERIAGNKDRHLREAAKFRLEFDNDVAFGSDNQFSNGWSIQLHTAVADSWQTVDGPGEAWKKLGAWLPSLTGEGLKYRMNFGIGQIIQTPDDLEDPDFIANDVPYTGLLAWHSAWTAFNDVDFRGFQTTLGVVGRPSFAEQTQNFVHKITGSEIAEGWDNQLEDELVVNLNYMRKKKFYKTDSFDAAVSGLAALGTMFTVADVRLETRFGRNMPRGFVYTPEPIGRTVAQDATLAPANPRASSFYGSLALGAAAQAHNILLDGNVYKDAPDTEVEKEDFTGFAIFGVHYERETWGAHLDFVLTTDVIDTDTLPTDAGDPDNNFGSFTFEWRI